MSIDRRSLLKTGLALPLLWLGCDDEAETSGGAFEFGALEPDPEGVMDLPPGFRYVVLEKQGDLMSDAQPMAERPDGMACFLDEEGRYVVMRNHELDTGGSPLTDVAYDANRNGGVSRVVVDPDTLERVSSNLVLTGTSRNCAGGPSPWGWLSCEETEEPRHGYVFLCDPAADEAQPPQRLKSLGRFKHEAAAVDPATNIIYLTEDLSTGAFYRHLPADKAQPFVGKLQAMKVVGVDRADTSAGAVVGQSWEIEWVDVPDPDAEEIAVAIQAEEAGAALVARGEGCWFASGSVFFSSTSGGPLGRGQIFRLDPGPGGDRLTLIAQVEREDDPMNAPDNVTVAPWGDVFCVEDNDFGPNHILRVRPDGTVERFGRNALNGGISELCGVCFSPDGRVMFVNIQEEGYTLAITGPFPGV